jgi:tellurite methyltransferase
VGLARHGLETTAWDVSEVAIERLQALADSQGLPLRAEVRDLESWELPCEAFDVIVVSRFLLRSLAVGLMNALKPGGLLFFQTYLLEKDPAVGPTDPSFLLKPNELRELFAPLRLLFYREEGQMGDLSAGFRNEAMFIGQKP